MHEKEKASTDLFLNTADLLLECGGLDAAEKYLFESCNIKIAGHSPEDES
jgi:hypothetical protein